MMERIIKKCQKFYYQDAIKYYYFAILGRSSLRRKFYFYDFYCRFLCKTYRRFFPLAFYFHFLCHSLIEKNSISAHFFILPFPYNHSQYDGGEAKWAKQIVESTAFPIYNIHEDDCSCEYMDMIIILFFFFYFFYCVLFFVGASKGIHSNV